MAYGDAESGQKTAVSRLFFLINSTGRASSTHHHNWLRHDHILFRRSSEVPVVAVGLAMAVPSPGKQAAAEREVGGNHFPLLTVRRYRYPYSMVHMYVYVLLGHIVFLVHAAASVRPYRTPYDTAVLYAARSASGKRFVCPPPLVHYIDILANIGFFLACSVPS